MDLPTPRRGDASTVYYCYTHRSTALPGVLWESSIPFLDTKVSWMHLGGGSPNLVSPDTSTQEPRSVRVNYCTWIVTSNASFVTVGLEVLSFMYTAGFRVHMNIVHTVVLPCQRRSSVSEWLIVDQQQVVPLHSRTNAIYFILFTTQHV